MKPYGFEFKAIVVGNSDSLKFRSTRKKKARASKHQVVDDAIERYLDRKSGGDMYTEYDYLTKRTGKTLLRDSSLRGRLARILSENVEPTAEKPFRPFSPLNLFSLNIPNIYLK